MLAHTLTYWARTLAILCPMLSITVTGPAQETAPAKPSVLMPTRSSAGDLKIGGELPGLPRGTLRYIRYKDLLALPQETYTISDDSNFNGEAQISGVALTTLAKLFERVRTQI